MQPPSFWPTPPILSGPWHELDPGLTAELRQLLVSSQIRCFPLVNAGSMAAYRVRPLPFWRDWMWIDALVETRTGPATAAFLYGPHGAHAIEGGSALVHDINDSGILDLSTPDLACDYLRFFCSAVRADEGPFYLLESPERFAELTGDALPDRLAGYARPVLPRRAPEGWRPEAVVHYGTTLFRAHFSMTEDGLVEMTHDTVLHTDLPPVPIAFDGLVARPSGPGGLL
ncbi:MAG TPA: hypothetical protein PKD99_13430 [Sphingopyxis sp.]|nr:hypothetical protein [Sphingopyxis sp.]HMP46097.1 hypothetical protein [Sphingopyxis sp.]HMQ18606.1 hypothetical protein [Sphingopyxis sp.]